MKTTIKKKEMMEQNNNQAEHAAPQKVDTERWKTDGK